MIAVIQCLGLDDDVRGVEGLDERLGEMVRVDFDGFGLECVDPVGRIESFVDAGHHGNATVGCRSDFRQGIELVEDDDLVDGVGFEDLAGKLRRVYSFAVEVEIDSASAEVENVSESGERCLRETLIEPGAGVE